MIKINIQGRNSSKQIEYSRAGKKIKLVLKDHYSALFDQQATTLVMDTDLAVNTVLDIIKNCLSFE